MTAALKRIVSATATTTMTAVYTATADTFVTSACASNITASAAKLSVSLGDKKIYHERMIAPGEAVILNGLSGLTLGENDVLKIQATVADAVNVFVSALIF